MKAIVILFEDTRLEGVEAVIAIPEGMTAQQTYDAAMIQLAAEADLPVEDYSTFRKYEVMDVQTLPLIPKQ